MRFLQVVAGAAEELTKGLQTLDGELQARTYLVGETVTAADLSLVAALHPYIVRSLRSPFHALQS